MRQTYYVIDGQRCRRCGTCERVCPHGALVAAAQTASDGAPAAGRKAPVIDQARCRHCGMCFRACRFNAVTRPYELYQLRDGRNL